MKRFNSSITVGEVVAALPEAAEIFRHYGIDFCCGGNKQLSDAIKEKNLHENEILKKLDEAAEKSEPGEAGRNFRTMTPSELIRHIENTHHVYLRKVLPELSELTVKILRAHGANHKELFTVHKLFSTLRAELEQHLLKEEEFLFPLVKKLESDQGEKNPEQIRKLVKETENEHDSAGNILKELRKITMDYQIPADGCNTYRITYKMLEELEGDLFHHIHLENNILFKKIRQGKNIT